MAPKYDIGRKVVIAPIEGQHFTGRDAGIESYAGQSGEVTDYYSITSASGEVFYIYTVQLEDKEIVLHEDELEVFVN